VSIPLSDLSALLKSTIRIIEEGKPSPRINRTAVMRHDATKDSRAIGLLSFRNAKIVNVGNRDPMNVDGKFLDEILLNTL
jgi:hypothetical protein